MRTNVDKVFGGSFLIFICLSSGIYAQSNFTEGYVVTQDRDTTFGYIDYQEWVQTPDTIFFKEEKNLKSIAFGASDLIGFYVAGEIYEPAEVSIDLTPKEIRSQVIRSASGPQSKTKRVFLQALVKGEGLSLYMYYGNRENFYINNGQGYLELISHEFVINRNGNYLVNSGNKLKYISQLRSASPACVSLLDKKKPAYSAISLITYITDCNEYVGDQAKYTFKPKGTVIKHGAVLGTGIIIFDRYLDENIYAYRSSRNFTVGYSADFVLPRGREKKTISTQLLYSYIDAKANDPYTEYYLTSVCGAGCLVYHQDRYEKISMGYLKLNITYSHKYRAKGLSPVFLVGGSLGMLLPNNTKGSIERDVIHRVANSRTIESTTTIEGNKFEAEKIVYNIHAGIGLAYGKAMVSLIYKPNYKLQDLKIYTYVGLSLKAKYMFSK